MTVQWLAPAQQKLAARIPGWTAIETGALCDGPGEEFGLAPGIDRDRALSGQSCDQIISLARHREHGVVVEFIEAGIAVEDRRIDGDLVSGGVACVRLRRRFRGRRSRRAVSTRRKCASTLRGLSIRELEPRPHKLRAGPSRDFH